MRLKRLFAATLAVLFLLPAVPAAAISTKRVEAVSFSDGDNGYLVGGSYLRPGFLSVTTDGGDTWSATLGGSGTWFKSVAAAPSGAWAFSEFQRFPYFTAFNSGVWNPWTGVGGTGEPQFSDVAVLADGSILAVGKSANAVLSGNPALIARFPNGGSSWEREYEGPLYPPPTEDDEWTTTNAQLVAVDALGSTIFAAGNEYAPGSGADGSKTALYRWLIYKSTDGGLNWAQVTTPATTGYPITSVAVGSASVAYAAGGNRLLLKTYDGGATWGNITFLRKDTFTSFYPNDIAAIDASNIVAVGDGGIVYKSTDGGATVGNITYSKPFAGNPALRDIEIIDADSWVVVGDDEAIYRTDNAGATWKPISTGLAAPAVAITEPSGSFPLTPLPVTVNGTAADAGVGVASTQVRIRRADGKTWHPIDGWVSSETWHDAQTSDGWKHWTFSWTPDATTLAMGQIVTLTARATDGVGLSSLSGDVSSRIATVGSPVAAVSVAGGAVYTNDPSAAVDVFADPQPSHMRWRVAPAGYPATWTTYDTTAEVDLGADGLKTVSVQFSADGSTSFVEASDDVYLDTVAPSVSFSAPPAGNYSRLPRLAGIPMTIASIDGLSQVAFVRMRIMRDGQYWNGNSWQPSEFLLDTSPSGAGSWSYNWVPDDQTKSEYRPVSFAAVAEDQAGNRAVSAAVTLDPIASDTAAPEVSFTTLPAGDYTALSAVPMTIRAVDAATSISAVQVRIMRDGQYWNGAGWQASEYLLPTASAGADSGTYSWVPDAATKAAYRPVTFAAVADDIAGNRALSSAVTLDPIDPVTLTSSVAPSITSYGTSAVIKGTLTGPTGAVAGQPVELWYKSYVTGSVWKKSATVLTTGADGSVSWSVKPSTKTYYELRFAGGSGYTAATATVRSVDPKVSMTAPRNKSTVKKGRTYTWYGYIKPKHTSGSTAAYLKFYRYKSGKYVYYKTVKAKAIYYSSTTTKYAAKTSLPYTGKWRVRAYHNDAGHAPTYSSYLYKRVY